jgi:hypothetical protein
MNFIFHPEAIAYYEDCQEGLGTEFLEEAYSTIQRILTYPEAWTMLSAKSGRCLANRFPYGIIYQILNEDCIRIISAMQLNRKPDYWHKRK